MGFYILLYFCFGVTFCCEGHYFFCLAMGVTLDQYRMCIGLFNSFRVITCSAYFWAHFFSLLLMFIEISNAIYSYCILKFIMLSILPFLNYFSFSSGNSVASEFQFFTCFIAIVSSCNRGILTPILRRVGRGAPCLFVI